MNEDLKKSKNQEKWLKAKVFEIVDRFKRTNKGKEIGPPLEKAVKVFEKTLQGETIPSELTLPPAEDPEQECISINLRPSCLDNPEIPQIQKEAAKSLVHKFSEMGGMTKRAANQTGVIRDKVPNQGEYAFLYAGLSPDVEIVEIQYSGTGRIFGFFTQSTFNVVCIRTIHIENH
ncbi:MAG TPA: hypothetical protein VIJ29_02550 [Candidatus Paceibacterota bacterium]